MRGKTAGVRKKLKIYLPFTSNEIKRNMAYKGAFYLFVFCTTFSSFINFFLWKAIYGSAQNAILGGMSWDEMVVYVFMSYVTSTLIMVGISENVSEDVVKGTVAMNLIKPIDYRTSLIFQALGTSIYRFFVPSVLVWTGVEVYRVAVMKGELPSPLTVLLYLCSMLFSFLLYVLFDFCFGMIAFFTTYIFGLSMAKAAFLAFLTGQLIPLSFFPEAVQKVFEFLPFSSMVYTPVMIYLGKYSGQELLFVLGRQLIWIAALYGLGSLIWRRVTRRLVVLGG